MAKRKWTESQKLQQSQKIHNWQPWLKSTGPKTFEGKAICSQNAFKNSLSQRIKSLHKAVVALKRNWQKTIQNQNRLLTAKKLSGEIK